MTAASLCRAACAAIAMLVTALAARPAFSDDVELVQETQMLRVTIAGKTVRLGALILKRADATGRLPVAFMNHGRPNTNMEALQSSLTTGDPGLLEMSDMARRGWLVVAIHRRGYGLSDGPWQSDDATCALGTAMAWMDADADDIQAAIEVIAQRSDADPTKMITMGISAGGGTSVALGARNIPGLVAAIDIAGGEHLSGCNLIDQSIAIDFKDLGSRNRIPNLWIFAQNDRNHPPEQVERMRAAFVGAGADLKLAELEAMGSDGHAAMGSFLGRAKWLAEVDTFLRDHNLPTWSLAGVDEALRNLKWPASQRAFVAAYLAAPAEKALAYAPGSQIGNYAEAVTLDAASNLALTNCRKKAAQCVIAMENDTWVAGKALASAATPAAKASQACTGDLNRNDLAAALVDCQQAIRLNPKDDSAFANRCGASDYKSDWSAALSDCDQAIKLNPKNEGAYVNRCFANVGLDKFADAVADCTKAIQLNPSDERPYNNRCQAYNFQANYVSALVDCSKAIELNPNYVFAYVNLCAASFGMGNNQDAIAQCTKAVALDDKAESAYVSLCGANSNLGNAKVALDFCDKAVALDPKDEQAYTNRCNAYDSLGNYAAALADCNKAVALNPKFALAYDNLCNVYNNQGNPAAALAACAQAIAIDAKDDYGYVHRGIAHEKMKDYKAAIADYSQAVMINPRNAEAFNDRCWDLAITGSATAALADCQKAITINPQYADALDSLGFVYLQLKQYQQSISAYARALAVNPKLASSLYGRGVAETRSGNRAAGNADIAAAKAIDGGIANTMAGIGVKLP
jgi:tetratricopeptide (TPR) repeat protein/pimeloyl-ACP methyl ester carboxylesterase